MDFDSIAETLEAPPTRQPSESAAQRFQRMRGNASLTDPERAALAGSAFKELFGFDNPDGSKLSPDRSTPLAPSAYFERMGTILDRGLESLDTPELRQWKAIPQQDREARLAFARNQRGMLGNAAARISTAPIQANPSSFAPQQTVLSPETIAARDKAAEAAATADDDELIRQTEGRLFADNWLNFYKTAENELSEPARKIARNAASGGNGIEEADLHAFSLLPQKEAELVGKLAVAAQPYRTTNAFSEAARQATHMVTDMGISTEEFLDEQIRYSLLPDRQAVSRKTWRDTAARMRLLRSTDRGRPYTDWSIYAQAVVGAGSTLPYAMQAMIPVVGAPLTAMQQFQRVRDDIIDSGGNPDEAVAMQAACAIAYAYVERMSSLQLTKPLTTLGRRSLFLAATKGGARKLAGAVIKETAAKTAAETFEEMSQAAMEAIPKATAADKDAVYEATKAFVNEAQTWPTMLLLSAGGTAITYGKAASASASRSDLAETLIRKMKLQLALSGQAYAPDKAAQAETLNQGRDIWNKAASESDASSKLQEQLDLTAAQADALADYYAHERAYLTMPGSDASVTLPDLSDIKAAVTALIPGATVTDLNPATAPVTSSASAPLGGADNDPEPPKTILVRTEWRKNGKPRRITAPNPAHSEWQARKAAELQRPGIIAEARPNQYRVTLPAGKSYIIDTTPFRTDIDSSEFADSVEQATGGNVKAADWMQKTQPEKMAIMKKYGLKTRGHFRLLDEQGQQLTDSVGIMQLITEPGAETQAKSDAGTLLHEHAHAAYAIARQTGMVSAKEQAVLDSLFTRDDGTFDEETFAQTFIDYAARRALPDRYAAQVAGPFQRIKAGLRDFIGTMMSTPETPATQLARAKDAAYSGILTGDWQGLSPYAGIEFRSKKPAQKAAAQPIQAQPPEDPKQEAATAAAAQEAVAKSREQVLTTASEPLSGSDKKPSRLEQKIDDLSKQVADLADLAERITAGIGHPLARAQAPRELTLVTPTGNIEFTAQWSWAELADLVTSDSADYPQQYQPRDRSRVASAAQVAQLSRPGVFKAIRLTDSVESDGGSPILAGGLTVLSGNGRSFILRAVDKEGRYEAEYIAPVLRWAEQRGIDAPPAGMKKPVLVRRITSIHSEAELQKIAELSNRPKILQRSEAETAEADAKLLTPQLLSVYNPGADGNLLAAGNAPFMQMFVKQAGGEGATDSKGRADTTLAARVMNALMAAVIGTGTDARELIRALLERDPKAALGSLYNSILGVAGIVIDNDNAYPNMAIRPWLRQAIREYIGWRTSAPEMTLDDFISQPDWTRGELPPETVALMRIIQAGRLSAVIQEYARIVRVDGSATAALFSEMDRTPLQTLAMADRATLEEGKSPVTPEPAEAAAISTKAPVQATEPLPPPGIIDDAPQPAPAPVSSSASSPLGGADEPAKPPKAKPQPSRRNAGGLEDMLASIDAKTKPPRRNADPTPDAGNSDDFFDVDRFMRETPMLPASTSDQFRAQNGNPDGNKVKKLMVYPLNGNKGDIIAESSDFFVALAKKASVVYDCFCGGALYTHTLAHLGALPEGSRLNEFEYTRWIINYQIKQNPEDVIAALDALRDRFLKDNPPVDRPKEQALADRQQQLDWLNKELNGENEGSPKYIETTTLDSFKRLPLANTPQMAALYMFTQNHATQSRAKDVELVDGKARWMQDAKPAGKDDFLFIGSNGKWNTATRTEKSVSDELIRQASRRLSGTHVTLGDGWAVALEAPANALVFIDSSYFDSTNYGSGTQNDGKEEDWLKKVTTLAQRKDVTYVITNNFRNSAVDALERLGFTLARAVRDGTENELVAVSGNAEYLIPKPIRTVNASGSPTAGDLFGGGMGIADDGAMEPTAAGTQAQDAGMEARPGQQPDGSGSAVLRTDGGQLGLKYQVTARQAQDAWWKYRSNDTAEDSIRAAMEKADPLQAGVLALQMWSSYLFSEINNDTALAMPETRAFLNYVNSLPKVKTTADKPLWRLVAFPTRKAARDYFNEAKVGSGNPVTLNNVASAFTQEPPGSGFAEDIASQFGQHKVWIRLDHAISGRDVSFIYASSPATARKGTEILLLQGTSLQFTSSTMMPDGTPVIVGKETKKQGTERFQFQTDSTDQTTTPEFKAWFKNSKVVDADGKPLVVYHGTDAKFNAFDQKTIGRRFRQSKHQGFNFTSNPDMADVHGNNVMPVYLSIQNPLVVDLDKFAQPEKLLDLRIEEDENPAFTLNNTLDSNAAYLKKVAEKFGHDGIVGKHSESVDTQYIAFSPTQIKSATDNVGTFSSKNPDIRHQVTAIGRSANSPEGIAAAAYAYEIALGETPTPDRVGKLLREMGSQADPEAVLRQAKNLSATIDPRTEELVARKQDTRLLDQLADQADRDLYISRIGAAFDRGRQSMADAPLVVRKMERARQRTAKLELESAVGYLPQQIALDCGIDLSEALLKTPDIQPTAEEKERREAAREKAMQEQELELSAAEAGPEPDHLPPTPEMQALLDQLLAEAEAKTQADQAEAERKRLEKQAADDPESADPSSTSETPGGPDNPDPIYDLVAPVIENPAKWVNFIYAYATRRIQKERPHLEPRRLYRDPAALRDLQRTYQHLLGKLAADHLAYGPERLAAQRDIAAMSDLKTVASTLRDATYIYSRLHANALRISREELVDALERDIRRVAIEPGRFVENRRDEKRKVTAKVEKYARTIVAYLRLTQNQIQAESDRLKEIISGASGSQDITKAQQDAIDQLGVLNVYGGMIHWMPGQITEAAHNIAEDLAGKRQAFEEAREKRDAEAQSIAASLAMGIMNSDPEAARPQHGRFYRFFDAVLGNLQQRLDNLIRFQTDPAKRTASKQAIEDLMVEIGQGSIDYQTVLLDGRKWLNKTLKDVYGNELAGVRHLDEAIPATVALPDGTQAPTAQLSRHGNALTYGQAIQLYGSILQTWYASNVRLHGRHRDLPILEAVLSDKDMALHKAMLKYYSDNRSRLSAAQERITGLPILTPDPLFMPARMRREPEGASGRHLAWTPIVKHLSPRVRNRLDFDEDVSVLDTFADSLNDTALITAYGERGIYLVKTILSGTVLGAIDRYHGAGDMAAVRSQVEDVLRAGATLAGSDAAHSGAAVARRWTARFGLSGNLASALKQLASVPVWAGAVGFRNLWKYMSTAHTEEGRAAIRELMQSDGFRARYETGWSPESADILSQQHVSWLGKQYDKGLAPNRAVDAVAGIWIAQGLYRDLKAGFIDKGLPQEEAVRRAQVITWNLVEQTQQSGRQENLPRFIREGGQLARFITQFQLSPLQQMAFEITAFREAAAKTPGYKAKLASVLLINHLLVPGLLMIVQDGWNALLGEPPDEDQLKSKLPEAIAAAILGQFSALWIIGSMGTDGIATLLGAKPRYGSGEAVPAAGAIRVVKQAAKTGNTVAKLMLNLGLQPSDMYDVTTADLLKNLDRLADQVAAPYRHASAAIENYTADQ